MDGKLKLKETKWFSLRGLSHHNSPHSAEAMWGFCRCKYVSPNHAFWNWGRPRDGFRTHCRRTWAKIPLTTWPLGSILLWYSHFSFGEFFNSFIYFLFHAFCSQSQVNTQNSTGQWSVSIWSWVGGKKEEKWNPGFASTPPLPLYSPPLAVPEEVTKNPQGPCGPVCQLLIKSTYMLLWDRWRKWPLGHLWDEARTRVPSLHHWPQNQPLLF